MLGRCDILDYFLLLSRAVFLDQCDVLFFLSFLERELVLDRSDVFVYLWEVIVFGSMLCFGHFFLKAGFGSV